MIVLKLRPVTVREVTPTSQTLQTTSLSTVQALSKSIDVVAADSAKQLAAKINAVSGSTKVQRKPRPLRSYRASMPQTDLQRFDQQQDDWSFCYQQVQCSGCG